MKKKIRVGLLFGGKSSEHEISLLSAKAVIDAIDRDKYEVILIGIDKNGEWHLRDAAQFLAHAHDPKQIHFSGKKEAVAVVPKEQGKKIVSLNQQSGDLAIDVIFPILHGMNGEDGTVQGILKIAEIPFVGAGVLGSAVGMDKDVMKRLLRDAKIPTAKFLVFQQHESSQISFEKVVEQLGFPVFVKPASAGSSIGVVKVKKQEDFRPALEKAFQYDRKILIEEYIIGREIECAVLGNEHPIVSLPGEVIPHDEYQTYETKYYENRLTLKTPAQLDPLILSKVQMTALNAYKVLCCEGMARVDLFLKENGDVVVNEINTIPGFTSTSVYPKLWEATGVSYSEIIDRLIHLAFDRFEKEKQLRTFVELHEETIC